MTALLIGAVLAAVVGLSAIISHMADLPFLFTSTMVASAVAILISISTVARSRY